MGWAVFVSLTGAAVRQQAYPEFRMVKMQAKFMHCQPSQAFFLNRRGS